VTLHVEVTAEDIFAGAAGKAYHCPIARALKRAGASEARVDYADCSLAIPGRSAFRSYDLPPEACEFRERFDGGEAVEPFAFDLEVHTW
jgi:hypothetical protein